MIIFIAVVASAQRKPSVIVPHCDFLCYDCCFQNHGQGSEPLCWPQPIQTLEIPFSRQHNTEQCAAQETATGYYKPNSMTILKVDSQVQVSIFHPQWINSSFPDNHTLRFSASITQMAAECRGVSNLMQGMFYSSKTSKHRKSGAGSVDNCRHIRERGGIK